MTPAWYDCKAGLSAFLQQFFIELDRLATGTLLSASPLAIKIGGIVLASEM